MALTKVTGQVIKNTTDVTVGVLTVTNTLAVGGTVSIGGTLTYEDVTNVDAVGLITARNGIVVGSGITLSKDGDIFATGVTTSTTFVGNLTGNVTGNISGGTVAGSTGTFTGDVAVSGANITLQDSGGATDDRISIGAGGDIHIYHNGTDSYVSNATGDLNLFSVGGNADDVIIRAQDDIELQPNNGEAGIKVIGDGAVELYHDNSKMIETDANGVKVGDGNRYIVGDDADGYLRYISNTVEIYVAHAQPFKINLGSETALLATANGSVDLYYNNSKKFETTGSGAIVTGITTSQAFVPSEGQLSHRNLVVNGAMRVAQRGTSYTGGYGTANNGLYYKTVDRMFVSASNLPNTDVTTAQHALTSSDTGPYELGFRYAMQLQMGYQGSVPSNVSVQLQYRMEAQDLATSGWNHTSSSSYLTLSFWAKSSVSQTFYGLFRTIDGTQYKYPFSYALTADTWKKVIVTIPGNSNLTLSNDTGEGFRINLAPYLGTDNTSSGVTLNTWSTHSNSAKTPDQTSTWYSTNGATFEVTGLQLEVGQVATPFEHRKFAEDLALCKRYYQQIDQESSSTSIITGFGNGTGRVRAVIPLMVEMRSNPVVTLDTSGGNPSFYSYTAGPPSYSSLAGVESTTKTITVDINTSSVTAGAPYDWRGSAAFITIDAEY